MRNLFRHLSDLDAFFCWRAPKLHARQLLEQHALAQDKRGSKARPQASSNSKDINVHAIDNHFQNLARTFVTPLGDFYMFFCVMGLEADTVCINNATHPSRPG